MRYLVCSDGRGEREGCRLLSLSCHLCVFCLLQQPAASRDRNDFFLPSRFLQCRTCGAFASHNMEKPYAEHRGLPFFRMPLYLAASGRASERAMHHTNPGRGQVQAELPLAGASIVHLHGPHKRHDDNGVGIECNRLNDKLTVRQEQELNAEREACAVVEARPSSTSRTSLIYTEAF